MRVTNISSLQFFLLKIFRLFFKRSLFIVNWVYFELSPNKVGILLFRVKGPPPSFGHKIFYYFGIVSPTHNILVVSQALSLTFKRKVSYSDVECILPQKIFVIKNFDWDKLYVYVDRFTRGVFGQIDLAKAKTFVEIVFSENRWLVSDVLSKRSWVKFVSFLNDSATWAPIDSVAYNHWSCLCAGKVKFL